MKQIINTVFIISFLITGILSGQQSISFSFNYAGSINGTFSVSGDFNPLIIPSDGVVTAQEEIDGITYSTFSGVEAVSIDSINLGAILLQQAGELVLGEYPVDPVTNSAMFGFALGATVTEFPDDIDDLEADAIYLSIGGLITITEITETTKSGTFFGFMMNMDDPADIVEVNDGEFTVNTATIFQPYLEGDYSFDYLGTEMSGNYSVSGTIDPFNLPTEGTAGFYGFSSDTSILIITGVETFIVDEVDSVNIGAIIINKPGELEPGTYTVDPIFQTVLFAFVLGADFTTIPEDLEDIVADKVYISATGSITISELSDSSLTGSFSGAMLNLSNPLDFLSVTNGSFSLSPGEILAVDDSNPDISMPSLLELKQNYPNPFNPVTTIKFILETQSIASLQIFDVNGRQVETLLNERLEPGFHSVQWNAQNESSGIYFYRISAGEFSEVGKCILLK